MKSDLDRKGETVGDNVGKSFSAGTRLQVL